MERKKTTKQVNNQDTSGSYTLYSDNWSGWALSTFPDVGRYYMLHGLIA